MTAEALSMLIEAGLDAMNVDVKGDASAVQRFCGGIDVEKIWAACRAARSRQVHVEITTLVIPGVNDTNATLEYIARRIVDEIGLDVPWHVTAYRPAYKFEAPATPVSTLERAHRIGKASGLEYVYTGNVLGHPDDNTYCPQCNTLLIQRFGFDVIQNRLRAGHCHACGHAIGGVWEG
jgi:pyruvate formate lyase activating enzyme